jgi:SanA protein
MLRLLVSWLLVAISISLVVGLFIGGCSYWIVSTTQDRVFFDAATLPKVQAGVVLGTSPRLAGGRRNPYFDRRIAAAAALFRAGKVRQLILSGAKNSAYYDEPEAMRKALLEQGVSDAALIQDRGGFRTLESIARVREEFGLSQIIVISDKFHVYRALFLCRRMGVDAIAFASPEEAPMSKTELREHLARGRAVLDVILFGIRPSSMRSSPATAPHVKASSPR